MQATTGIFYQKTPLKRTKANLIPVKLRVQRGDEKKYYSLKEKISNHEWLFIAETDIPKVITTNPRGRYKDIAIEYARIVRLAEAIIKDIAVFSFGLFEEKFFNKTGSWDNVFSAMIEHIKELKLERRFSYASSFESTLRTIKEFHLNKKLAYNSRDKVEGRYTTYEAGKPLTFQDITTTWLKKFHNHMEKRGNSPATVGINMRNIRRLFNLAIKKHQVPAIYPFTDYDFPGAGNRKIAITAYQIAKIINFDTDDPRIQFSRDIFAFSFFGNGMNMADVLRLKYSNIKSNELEFLREKTKRSKKPHFIRVPITGRMQQIIDRYGNKAIGHNAFIFPVLRQEWNAQKQFYEVKEFTLRMNDHLKQIASKVGITEKISSMVSRHSWATISKSSGASTEYIKESLGHSSVLVTEAYLKDFEYDTRREHSNKMENKINNAV